MDVAKTYCKHIKGKGIPLTGDDIDTDRIIPARYMKCITFAGLGYYAFYDERYDEQENHRDHPFNDSRYANHDILLVNSNFGCGSSREHAPQSLMGFGIRALIGESFSEIFAGNCTAMGIPAVTVTYKEITELMAIVENEPETSIDIDLESKTVAAGKSVFPLDIQESYRRDLISGTWDNTAVLLSNKNEILTLSESIPYMNDFRSDLT